MSRACREAASASRAPTATSVPRHACAPRPSARTTPASCAASGTFPTCDAARHAGASAATARAAKEASENGATVAASVRRPVIVAGRRYQAPARLSARPPRVHCPLPIPWPDSSDELKRTHHNGESFAGETRKKSVVLFGWVSSHRDHGGLVFIDLRDREGITQLVFDPAAVVLKERGWLPADSTEAKDAHALAQSLRSEWVVGVRGYVVGREANVNEKLPTGHIEVHAVELVVFNRSETPPFEIADSIDTSEEKRLEYRYLDLRRAPLQRTLRVRHRINQVTRRYFDDAGFLELETPVMVKYTPGGARNFLVPSRMHAGKFYALAESPQLFKQLYMVAGLFEKYFQIVKCFRDEDLRLDRQLEFTQIDVEMSFVNQEDVFRVMEGLVVRIWKEILGVDLTELYPGGRFPRMPFAESMGKYGNDKPDLRFGLPHVDLTSVVVEHGGGGVPFWKTIADKFTSGEYRADLPAEIVKAIRVPGELAGKMSRAEIEKLEDFVKGMGAKGLARAKLDAEGNWVQSPLAKMITPEASKARHQRRASASPTAISCSSSSAARPPSRR